MWLCCGSVDSPESFYARVRILATKKEDEKVQQKCICKLEAKCKLEAIVCLLGVMSSVYNKVITNQPICKVLKK